MQNVSFGNNKDSRPSFFSTVKTAAAETIVPVVAGGALGGGVGKLVSLTPYKPKEDMLQIQYKDMFQKALKSEELPDYIKTAGGDFVDITNKGKIAYKELKKVDDLLSLAESTQIIKDKKIASSDFQSILKEILGENNFANKEEILKAIEAKLEPLKESYDTHRENYKAALDSFVEKACEEDKIVDIAKKGAKQLRKRCIIGAGIMIGAFGALILNVLRTNGAFNFKKPKAAQEAAGQTQQAQ